MKYITALNRLQSSHHSADTIKTASQHQAAETLEEINQKTPSLREYFAAKAMQLIKEPEDYVGEKETADSYRKWAEKAYKMADAMLEASK